MISLNIVNSRNIANCFVLLTELSRGEGEGERNGDWNRVVFVYILNTRFVIFLP